MSRGFRIFLFAVLSLAAFWTYQFRKSDLARLFQGFYDQLIRVDSDVKPPWRLAVEEYNRRYPVDGLPNPTGNPVDDIVIVEVREELSADRLHLEAPPAVAGQPAAESFVDASIDPGDPAQHPEGEPDGSGAPEDGVVDSLLSGQEGDDTQPSREREHSDTLHELDDLADAQTPVGDDAGAPGAPRQDAELERIEHLVTDGDRLWDIAERYLGKGHRYPEILRWNGLQEELLKPGMRLKIFVPSPQRRLEEGSNLIGSGSTAPTPKQGGEVVVHQVREGDSLASLARRYYAGDSDAWERIYRANRDVVRDPNVLEIDMELRIPEPRRRRAR